MRYEMHTEDNLLLFDTRNEVTLIQGENLSNTFHIEIPRLRESLDLGNMAFALKGTIVSTELREYLTDVTVGDSKIDIIWTPSRNWTIDYGILRLTLVAVESDATDLEDPDSIIAKWTAAEGIRVLKDARGVNHLETPDAEVQLLQQMATMKSEASQMLQSTEELLEEFQGVVIDAPVGDLVQVSATHGVQGSGYCYQDLKQREFSSYEEAVTYATTNEKAYVGQSVTVIDDEESAVAVYIISNEDGALTLVGKSSLNDYETLENLPRINDVVLRGNKSIEDIGIHSLTNTEIEAILNA